MRRDEALRILAEHREEIAALGATSVSLFGSVARDEAGPESDVDLLVEVRRPFGLFEFVGLQQYLQTVLEHRVDLVTLQALRPHIRAQVLREAVRAA